jgi:predicted ATPase/class 3 adenylate cyclase
MASEPLPQGTATFLFTDIQGSTALVQQVGLERWKEILETHCRLLREHLLAAGGVEVSAEGDSLFVAFAQAGQAVAACAAAQRALHAHPWPEDALILVRMGLHTGDAAVVSNDYVGLDIHRAARIASAGHGGQVVLSDTTRMLVEGALPKTVSLIDLGEHRLKDLARPERIWQLRIEELPSEFPALSSLDNTPNNLPTHLTSFVGRDRELAEGLRLLASSRLLTLTGPGGTGKTRLAIQLAAEASDTFKHGVFFVPLAQIGDPELVPSTVLATLGVLDLTGKTPRESLLHYLRDRDTLLILDNFEQLPTAAEYVAEILKASPGSKVVATSRAALKVSGEQLFPVPPLEVPEALAALSRKQVSRFDGVRLFVERARAQKPDFALTDENASAIAGIVALVDGLPLAIELAASRIKLFPPKNMLLRLEARLTELGGGARDLPERHQTLRGAISWSYDLLDQPARRLFERLSVFVRGGSLDQIEAVCGSPADSDVGVIDALETLLDNNLVRAAEGVDEPRFSMLNVIRKYALDRLAERPDGGEIERRHATVFADLVESGWTSNAGPEQKRWLDKLELEHDNLRAALTWAIKVEDSALASRLLVWLWRFWQMRGHLFEASLRAHEVLAIPGLAEQKVDKYRALEAAGSIAYWQGDQDSAGRHYGEALNIARTLNDRPLLAQALYNAGFPLTIARSNPRLASAIFDEALALFRELGDEAGSARTLWGAAIAKTLGDPPDLDAAIAMLLEARDVLERLGDAPGLGWAHYVLGWDYTSIGRYVEARQSLLASLDIFSDLRDRSGAVLLLDQFAVLAIAEGDPDRAARLSGVRSELEAVSGIGLLGTRVSIAPELDEAVANLPQTHPDAFAAGRAMELDEALALAREPAAPPH